MFCGAGALEVVILVELVEDSGVRCVRTLELIVLEVEEGRGRVPVGGDEYWIVDDGWLESRRAERRVGFVLEEADCGVKSGLAMAADLLLRVERRLGGLCMVKYYKIKNEFGKRGGRRCRRRSEWTN